MLVQFGKHKGKTVQEIWDAEPSYVAWIVNRRHSGAATEDLAKYIIHDFFMIPRHSNDTPVAIAHAIQATASIIEMMHHSDAKFSIKQKRKLTKAQSVILNSLNGKHGVIDVPTVSAPLNKNEPSTLSKESHNEHRESQRAGE